MYGTNGNFGYTPNPNGINYGYRPVPAPSTAPVYGGAINQMNQPITDRIYVTGRIGADAYPMPQGVYQIILWDNNAKRLYIKGYDNNGIPRVLEDYDYSDHVEQEPQATSAVDLSNYATKDDIHHIQKMISEALNQMQAPEMAGYVTRKEFENKLSNLAVGNGGRIVTIDGNG